MRFFTSRRNQDSGAVSLRKSKDQPLAGTHHREREPAHVYGSTARSRVAAGSIGFLLAIAFGLSVAALVSTSWHRFWFIVSGSGVTLRTGYFQWEDGTGNDHRSLKDLNKGVYIMGIISLCFTGISALAALVAFFPVILRRASGKGLFLWAQLFSITFAGELIAFYIVTTIFEAKYLIPTTRALSIAHPDWGWCLAMGSAICWWLSSLIASVLPERQRVRAESLPIHANGMFAPRDFDSAAPLSSPKANESQPAWTAPAASDELPHKKPRRGLFSKKSSGAAAQNGVPNGALSTAEPATVAPSAPVAEPAIGTRYSQWIQNMKPNRIPTREVV